MSDVNEDGILRLRWEELSKRTSIHQRRLHACGCFRVERLGSLQPDSLAWIERAEQFADGAISVTEVTLAGTSPPTVGDMILAIEDEYQLNQVWSSEATPENGLSAPNVMLRLHVLEDLVGPRNPHFSRSWRTDTAIALTSQMYAAREFSAMPILADALQDAGCNNDDILNHCRDTSLTHVRGCWVVDLVLGKS